MNYQTVPLAISRTCGQIPPTNHFNEQSNVNQFFVVQNHQAAPKKSPISSFPWTEKIPHFIFFMD